MKSSIILNDLTCIDHAYIDSEGSIVGGSFLATVIVTGEVDTQEEVVIDFSTCKSRIKALIDDMHSGFDHKLWIMKSSNADVAVVPNGFTVTTPMAKLHLDQMSLRYVDCFYIQKSIGNRIAAYLEDCLNQDSATKYSISVRLSIDVHALHGGDGCKYFCYAHGLKNSSSYGCQNIAHGHLSYIQLLNSEMQPIVNKHTEELLNNVVCSLDNTYFVAESNVSYKAAGVIGIKYDACTRGEFSALFNTDHMQVKVLPVETTIEHLALYVKELCKDFPDDVKYIVVSEGLTKGSIIER